MRNKFINWLCEQAREDERIIFLTADLGYSVIEPFQNEFPNRCINVGVAEQNMVGIAAGLASEGFLPYTYSIGIFPTFRCAEQLRNDIDYHNLPVLTSTVGSGVTYGALGYTHHAIQDLALMRSLPNMVIATPSDPIEVKLILNWHKSNPCPLYLRMHKAGDKSLHLSEPIIELGKPLEINSPKNKELNSDTCILVAGYLAKETLDIEIINNSMKVFSMPLWGNPACGKLNSFLSSYKKIISLEDHLLAGGFSSWLLEETVRNSIDTKILPVTLPSEAIGKVASEKTLIKPIFDKLIYNIQKNSN